MGVYDDLLSQGSAGAEAPAGQSPPSQPATTGNVYSDMLAPPPPEPAAPEGKAWRPDWEDIGKGTAGGLGRGVAGTLGLPGTIGDLVGGGLTKLGLNEDTTGRAATVAGMAIPPLRLFRGATVPQVTKAIEGVTGEFYKPKTLPGQYASTIAEFAPAAAVPGGGGALSRVFNTVVPALASETAGQITKDTELEPYARGIAGVGAGLLGGKIVTPTAPASPARQTAVATLEREGIPITAGQRTGSRPLQWMEANAADMPGSASRSAQMKATQAAAFDNAVTRTMFDPRQLAARGVPEGVALPDPRAVTAGRASLSDEYNRLASANQLRADPQMIRDLTAAQTNYERAVLPSLRTRDLETIRNDIVDRLITGQGRMPGDVYQSTRSTLGTQARSAATQQPQLATALRDTRAALDDAMQRGLSPADAASWQHTNQRWANMRQLEGAVAAGGENLSPQRVAQSAKTKRPGQYAAQQTDLDRLAKAASIVIKPMPQSGTAPRAAMQNLFNLPAILTGAGGAGIGTALGGPIGGVIGAVAPFAIPRAALSRPGQAYLGNQLMPQNTRDILTQTLAQQAIAKQDADKKRRKER